MNFYQICQFIRNNPFKTMKVLELCVANFRKMNQVLGKNQRNK